MATENTATILDPKVKALASSILQHESGGNYQAKGGSGEYGGYQFMPATWKAWAGKHLGDANAPLSVENQNKVAYSQIKEWKDQGLTPAQIASKWNSGNPDAYKQGYVGTNSKGVRYDVPAYVASVSALYKQKSANIPSDQGQTVTPTATPTAFTPKIGILDTIINAVKNVNPAIGAGLKTGIDTAKGVFDSVTQLPGKLVQDVQQAANTQLQNKNQNVWTMLKSLVQGALRPAGDVASTIYSPITSAFGSVMQQTGLQKKIEDVSKYLVDKSGIADQKWLQDFAVSHPNAEEDLNRALTLSMAADSKAYIKPEEIINKTKTILQDTSNVMAQGSKTKFVENINNVFDHATQQVRKIVNYASEKGINIGQEIADRGIMPKVENDRMIFGPEPFKALDTEIAGKSNIIDELIKQYPDTKISAEEMKQAVARQISQSRVLSQEGRVMDVVAKANKIIDGYVAQSGKNVFNLNEIQGFKKGAWSATKKFKLTETGKSDAYSELGSTFMKIIEKEVPDANVHAINAEIGRVQELYKVLDKVNGLQEGGVVLKGGKIGKYVTNIFGTVSGAAIGQGLAPGPVGWAIGGITGNKLSSVLRSLSQKSSILSFLDRIFIKFAEKSGDSVAIKEAITFLEKIKAGEKPTVTPRVQKTFEEAINWYNKNVVKQPENKLLPEAKLGTPSGTIELSQARAGYVGKDTSGVIKNAPGPKILESLRPQRQSLTEYRADSVARELGLPEDTRKFAPPAKKIGTNFGISKK